MATTETLTFAELLRRYRRAAELTQEELAERAGLSIRAVGNLERGEKHVPRKETVKLVADALQLSEEDRAQLEAAARRARWTASDEEGPPGDRTDGATEHARTLSTFLIADVRGYTRFTVEHGDEAAAALTTKFASIVREGVRLGGGTLVSQRGDEAVAMFRSASEAVRTAAALQMRICQEADPSLPLKVGIGLDAGEVVKVGAYYRGGAINLTARLCSLAGPGEVLASEGVVHLARTVEGLQFVERGMVPLKGFPDPVEVVQVTQAGAGPERPEEARDGAPERRPQAPPVPIGNFLGALPPSPLVSREDELERLRFAVETVETGTGQLVLLAGETGIGKTRLAQEAALLARDHGFVVATGRCYERCHALALYPFVEALMHALVAAPSTLQFQARRRWPALHRLLDEQMSAPGETVGTGLEEEHRLFRAVTEFLAAIAGDRPVALLLDDLHWADEASLALLQHLARHTRAHRVLLVGTYRDVELDQQHPVRRAVRDLTREHLVERITLGRLPVEGTAAMVADVIAETEGISEFAEFVHRRTKGNPYFIDTMLQALGGHYRLIREIGAGGMGRVIEAVDTRTGERVAAKIMFSRSEAELDAVRRFQQEGAVLATLEHENIVKVKGTFIEEHASCIVMELLDGQSLGQIMAVEELSLARIKDLSTQVAAALAFAHEHHIIHRDVKPDNVMVVGDDRVKVTDFGIARILRPDTTLATFTSTGMTLGTPLYMAPEQIQGKRVDARADVYSLGAMLYHLVVGRPPFEGDDPLTVAYKHVNEAPEPPRSLDARVPPDWEALILKALAKSPADRFQSAARMEEAIARLSTEEAADAASEVVKEAPQPQGDGEAAGRSSARRPAAIARGFPRFALTAPIAAGLVLLLSIGLFLHQPAPATRTLPLHAPLAVWGTQRLGTGAFRWLAVVRMDEQGNLYVLDHQHRTILKRSPDGVLLAEWTPPRPKVSLTGKNAVIGDLAVDGRRDVYVTDDSDDTVKKLSPSGKLVATWGKPGAAPGEFAQPAGIALDAHGNLYVTDQLNFRVQKLSPDGRPLKHWGSQGGGTGQFAYPAGIAVGANGIVYVADSGNNRIETFTSSGKPRHTFTLQSSATGQGNQVTDVLLDREGNIYVVDIANRSIQKLSPGGALLAEWGAHAAAGGTFHNFIAPFSIAVDPMGAMYVADEGMSVVQKISPAGETLAQWTADDLTRPLFQTPQDVTLDASGNVYVTDVGLNLIDKLSPGGTLLARWGEGAPGPGSAKFLAPGGVAVDAQGNLYVPDSINTDVSKLSPTGRWLADWATSASTAGSQPVAGAAVDRQGDIFVAEYDQGRIEKLSPGGKRLAQWTLRDSPTGRRGTPRNISIDVHGNLYVTDTANDRVVELSSTAKVLRQWRLPRGAQLFGSAVDAAGDVYVTTRKVPHIRVFSSPGNLIGAWGTTGSAPGQFRDPSGIAVAKDGAVYVVDTGNQRIEKFSPIKE